MPDPRCERCRFAQLGTSGWPLRCHRYPPPATADDTSALFPVVEVDDWCGEYKARPTPADTTLLERI